jgi:hypothetical protein
VVVPAANVFTVPSFKVTVIGPVPDNTTFNVAVALSQIFGVPTLNTAVTLGITVIVLVDVVKPVVLELVVTSSVTLTNVYVVVLVGVPVFTLNGTPLVTLLIVTGTPPFAW